MGLAKRLAAMVDDGRVTEEDADAVLANRQDLWQGHEPSGQLLLFTPLAIAPLGTGNAKPTLIDWSTDELKPQAEPGEHG